MLIQMMGGLGNQMFIYAFAKAMERKGYDVMISSLGYDQQSIIHYDTTIRSKLTQLPLPTEINTPTIRRLEIEDFNLSMQFCASKKAVRNYLVSNDICLPFKYIYHFLCNRLLARYPYKPSPFKLYKHIMCEKQGGGGSLRINL